MSEDASKENLSDKLRSQLEAGELSQAKSTLSRAWRELIPEPPTRFVVSLRDVDELAARELMRRWKRSGKRPPVRLERVSGEWEIHLSRGEKLRVGRLPHSETRLLSELGSAASRYKPTVLSARDSDEPSGVVSVTVEMLAKATGGVEESQQRARQINELYEAVDTLTLESESSESDSE